MSIVDETSKVAQHVITTLNSVPVLLALVLLQFFILGSVMYLNLKRDANVHTRFMAMIERCTYPPPLDRRSGNGGDAPPPAEGPT
jgi:cytochrome bd-type quinol oxidase subunit 2